MKIKDLNNASRLVDYINNSPTMYNAVKNLEELLEENGFERLNISSKWELKVGGKYFVSSNSASIFAFVVNDDDIANGFRIIGSHSDSPTFKIKPNPEMSINGQLKLNVEPYGGMIISSWFDRPLGIAGRVFTKNIENVFKPKEHIINLDKPVCIIPNLAIHMNRDINNGYKYDKQNDVMPMILENGEALESTTYLKDVILEELNIKENNSKYSIEDILDFELFLYEYEKGSIVGRESEFISCGRLDNLASVFSSVCALIETSKDDSKIPNSSINMAAVFNNEEIGSQTREGADSSLLPNIIERISLSMGNGREEYLRSIENSFMFSADLTHAVHPNKPGVADPNHKPLFGCGPAIKLNSGKAYASDSMSTSVLMSLFDEEKIEYQLFVNKSDMRSGSTIGPIINSHLTMPTVDFGIPLLAMHSIRELCNVKDYENYYQIMEIFFKK